MPVDPLQPAPAQRPHNKIEIGLLGLFLLVVLTAGVLAGILIQKKSDEARLADLKNSADVKLADLEDRLKSIQLDKIRIYLGKDGAVIPAERRILEQKGSVPARLALDELMAGPTVEEKSLGLITFIPTDTLVVNFTLESGTATITFSKELNSGPVSKRALVRQQIEKTLLEFTEIHKTVIRIEGVADADVLK